MDIPDTRYAEAPDGTFIAFQTFGSGPIDILLMQGFFSHLDANWWIPEMVDFHERLGAFARVIAMDRRGMGLSDRLARGSSEPLEAHVDDVVAVPGGRMRQQGLRPCHRTPRRRSRCCSQPAIPVRARDRAPPPVPLQHRADAW